MWNQLNSSSKLNISEMITLYQKMLRWKSLSKMTWKFFKASVQSQATEDKKIECRIKGAVTLSNLSRNLSHNVDKKDFRIALQGMLHQAIYSMQLAMIITKNSIKTAIANVWRHIVSQKPIGSHSVHKHCETSCKRDVTLCNALKMHCSVAAIVAKSRTWFYFVQWLLQQKYCETCWLRGMIHLAISRAICVATKLRDKFHSVTAP